MKTRQGFVSNSSSSSFMVIGFATEDALDDEIIIEGGDGEELAVIQSLYIESDDGAYITGIVLADFSSEGELHNQKFSSVEIQEMINLVAEKTNTDKDKIKLFMGTRPS